MSTPLEHRPSACPPGAGNRPSLSILLPELNAYTLGQLLRWVGLEALAGHQAGARRLGACLWPRCEAWLSGKRRLLFPRTVAFPTARHPHYLP